MRLKELLDLKDPQDPKDQMVFKGNLVLEVQWDLQDAQEPLVPKDHVEIPDPLGHQDLEDQTPKGQILKEKWLVSLMDHLAQTSFTNTKMDQLDLWDHLDHQDHKDQKEDPEMLDQ